MNNYMKLLADLANMDGVIKDEDKALILLSSLPDEEHETFVLTLINDKASLSYNDVSVVFVNHDVRKKGKEPFSSSTTVETLTVRGIRSNHKKGKILISSRLVITIEKEPVCFLQERRTLKD